MGPVKLDPKAVADMNVDTLLAQLASRSDGLTQGEAAERLAETGPNSLPEQRISGVPASRSQPPGTTAS